MGLLGPFTCSSCCKYTAANEKSTYTCSIPIAEAAVAIDERAFGCV